MRTPRSAGAATGVLIAAGLSGAIGPVAAQEAEDEFIYGGVLGDIQRAETANPGRIHAVANLGVASADYFRGGFDDVPSDLDQIAYGPDLSVAFEVCGRTGRGRCPI